MVLVSCAKILLTDLVVQTIRLRYSTHLCRKKYIICYGNRSPRLTIEAYRLCLNLEGPL
jgi:hypothetical protein